MSQLYKRRVALAAIGVGTYPADPVPDETGIILTYGLQFFPFEGNTETLDPDRDGVGNGVEYYTGPHARVTFQVDLAGSGTNDEPPIIGTLLRMCAMSEDITVDTSVKYGLFSDLLAAEYGSLYIILHGGEQHKLTGVRGNARFLLSKEGMPKIEFTFMGLWDQTPTTVSLGALDYSAFLTPVAANAQNTTKLTIDGYSANCESATFDLGHQVEYRNVMGNESILHTDRAATAEFSIEKPSLANKDFYAVVRAHQVVTGTLTHGTAAGNIVTLPWRGQIKMSADTDSQGLAVMPMTARLIPSDAGNDELAAIFS